MRARFVVTGILVGIVVATLPHVRPAQAQGRQLLPSFEGFSPEFKGCIPGQDGAIVTRRRGFAAPVPASKTRGTLEPTIATNFQILDPSGTPESCDPSSSGYVTAPPELLDWTPTNPSNFKVLLTGYGPPPSPTRQQFIPPIPPAAVGINIGANEGRLRLDLTIAAKVGNPNNSLCMAAISFALGNASDGNAFADLSVTGRRAFAAFRAQPPDASRVLPCLQADARTQALPAQARQAAADAALDRAYRVLNLVRAGGWPVACPERAALRPQYIAVSGEDDQPHRPVNAPSAEFPQYDLAVSVPRPNGRPPLVVNTRYMIAHTMVPPGAERASCASTGRTIPAGRAPVLAPNAEVILYIHGMDSRLEEAMDLTHKLHDLGRQQGRNFTVISMDLPTSGYADNIDHTTIAPLSDNGQAGGGLDGLGFAPNGHTARLVDFDEDFIVSFINTLNQSVPVASHLRAIVGGSLGGNMAFRLGRPRADAPWVTNIVSWSPASIWPSFADDGVNHVGLAVPWYFAGGDPSYATETLDERRGFFYGGFDWQSKVIGFISVAGGRPQAEYWYRDGWSCKLPHIRLARIDRYETYNKNFRLWHWRLGMEQLQFSHQGFKPGTNQPLYLFNTKRMLLLCGMDDVGGSLCEHTRSVAPKMINTPGQALFLTTTGHSIHNERPTFLAQRIVQFIGPAPLTATAIPVALPVTIPVATIAAPIATIATPVATVETTSPNTPIRSRVPTKLGERIPSASTGSVAALRTLVVRVEQVAATDSTKTIAVFATDSETQSPVEGVVTVNGVNVGATGEKIAVPISARARGVVSAKGYTDAPFTP